MLMIYGPTGYTGRLVAQAAITAGLAPVLCGRSGRLEALATQLGAPARIAPLDDPSALAAAMAGVTVVLNCAGPFALSAPPLIAAAIRAGVHYCDLAGEVPEHLLATDAAERAAAAGVCLMPGVGFGVVPTDCAAVMAAVALPKAERLEIGYETRGAPSRGTLETVLPSLHLDGVRRRQGVLTPDRPGRRRAVFRDGGRRVSLVSNPWRADLVSAGRSTGIPRIETYSNFPFAARLLMRIGGGPLGRFVVRQALATASEGPDAAARAAGGTICWARATAGRRSVTAIIRGPDAYDFTAHAAIQVAARLATQPGLAGHMTPALAFGADFITAIPGVAATLVG